MAHMHFYHASYLRLFHKSKALASTFMAWLIGFYEVGWDVAPGKSSSSSSL